MTRFWCKVGCHDWRPTKVPYVVKCLWCGKEDCWYQ